MTVQNFTKIVWTVFEKFEIFMKRSGEKKHDCISSRKFFPTPKKPEFELKKVEERRRIFFHKKAESCLNFLDEANAYMLAETRFEIEKDETFHKFETGKVIWLPKFELQKNSLCRQKNLRLGHSKL